MKKIFLYFLLLFNLSAQGQYYLLNQNRATLPTDPCTPMPVEAAPTVFGIYRYNEATLIDNGVDSWTDLSGNGYHLQAPSAALRPTVSAQGLLFSGAQALYHPAVALNSEDVTIVLVGRVVNGGTGIITEFSPNYNGGGLIWYTDGASHLAGIKAGGYNLIIEDVPNFVTPVVYIASLYGSRNGATESEASIKAGGQLFDERHDLYNYDNNHTFGTLSFNVGARNAGGGLFANMEIKEMRVYGKLTMCQALAIEKELKSTYSIFN